MTSTIPQMSIKTVNRWVFRGKQTKFWIAGIKFDKYWMSYGQEVFVSYARPQQVTVVYTQPDSWYPTASIYSLKILDFDDGKTPNRTLAGWQISSFGIRFFRTQEHAERYFFERSHRLATKINPILQLHKDLYEKIEAEDPSYLVQVI